MSDITDLDKHKSVEQLLKELAILKRENFAAMKTVEKLLKDLSKKTEELQHMQSLVSQTVPVIHNKKDIEPAKDEIASVQLERLRNIANQRILTLEETRMFDILIKAQQSSNKEVKEPKATYRDVSDVELIQVAQKAYPVKDESAE